MFATAGADDEKLHGINGGLSTPRAPPALTPLNQNSKTHHISISTPKQHGVSRKCESRVSPCVEAQVPRTGAPVHPTPAEPREKRWVWTGHPENLPAPPRLAPESRALDEGIASR